MRRRSLVLLAFGAGAYSQPLLETGTGCAAHNACAVAFWAAGHDEQRVVVVPSAGVLVVRTALDPTLEATRWASSS